ncbi:hypothetical protein [Flammeovirga sp. SubArs3]|uniref:hypothetical protein n=1 Tax=Flammeovirga sp. SubArs3 TaxID=2995316 RepID=UPI00248C6A77|nr:hypothetical protein [Flammeovirga sp. SubArs3]
MCRETLRLICITFLFLTISKVSFSQTEDSTSLQKIKVKAYVPFIVGDSVYKYKKDTVVFIPKGMFEEDSLSRQHSTEFYNNLQKILGKRRLTRELSNLLLVNNTAADTTDELEEDLLNTGMCFDEKIVRSITFIRLPPFGGDVQQPYPIITTKVTRYANGIHNRTKEYVIDNNLIFNVGDLISDNEISESERILRTLPFIKDAEIYGCELPNNLIDIYVVTKDQWTIGVTGGTYNRNDFGAGVYNSNFLGMGQYVAIGGIYQPDSPKGKLGFDVQYNYRNISGTFIDVEGSFVDSYDRSLYEVSTKRDFITSATKWAGELDYHNNRDRYGYATSDSAFMDLGDTVNYDNFWESHHYSYLGFWAGYSIQLNKSKNRNLTFSAGIDKLKFKDRPADVSADTLYNYQDKTHYIGTITVNERHYRKLSYLQGFGRTEDVPYGWLFDVTAGFEDNEYYGNRPYIGASLDVGQFTPIGYFRINGNYGTFYNSKYQQQIVNVRFQYFTNLIAINRNFLRMFLYVDLTQGQDMVPGDYLYFVNNEFFTDYNINPLTKKGSSRIQIAQENVWFTPWYFYGFKFSIYQTTEIGLMRDNDNVSFSSDNIFSAFGLGVRTRNENLVFNTIAADMKYYPNTVNNGSKIGFNVYTEITLPLKDFRPTKPKFIPFE